MTETSYKIAIQGDWSLEDLYIFGRTFEQIYFFANSVMPTEDPFEQDRIEHTYAGFPWQGGYIAVNFFQNLKYIVPKRDRPRIISLHYASPGWIELSLLIGVAVAVERLIKTIANSIHQANATYHEVVTGLQKRKLLRLKTRQSELELKRDELAYIKECAESISDLLGFESVAQVNQLTGSPYKTLKILLTVYRRIRTLAEFDNKGKMKLPGTGL